MLVLSRLALLIFLLFQLTSLRAATITINELSDIDLGTVSPTTDGIRVRSSFCVSMTPRGPFQIIGRGTQPGGRFALSDPAGSPDEIEYSVFVTSRRRGLGRQLTPGVPVTGLRAARPRRNGRCRQTFITIMVDSQFLSQAAAGQYSGGLTLTVAPE